MKRILAHNIIYRGKSYPLSVATLSDDGTVVIAPFNGEEHSVTYICGTVQLSVAGNPPEFVVDKVDAVKPGR